MAFILPILGTIIGAFGSGVIIDTFFLFEDGSRNWSDIWLAFAAYSLVVTILFAILFKHKHNPEEIGEINH